MTAEIIGGRKDWDVIAFSDYRSDMDDLAGQSAAFICSQARKIAHLERCIAAIVDASGGKVSVQDVNITEGISANLVIEYSPADMTYRFRTVRQ